MVYRIPETGDDMRLLPENCFCVKVRRRQVGSYFEWITEVAVTWHVANEVNWSTSIPIREVIVDIEVDLIESAE